MNHPQRTIGMAGFGLLAGLILLAAPPGADAAKVGFHNKLTSSVNIDSYIVTVIRGKQVRVPGNTLQIDAGEVAGYPNVPTGAVLVIYVYDANQPSRCLYQGSQPINSASMFFAVKPTANPKKAKVVPAKPPSK
jgi:hypothetical protein